jgi:hypothetical protein
MILLMLLQKILEGYLPLLVISFKLLIQLQLELFFHLDKLFNSLKFKLLIQLIFKINLEIFHQALGLQS